MTIRKLASALCLLLPLSALAAGGAGQGAGEPEKELQEMRSQTAQAISQIQQAAAAAQAAGAGAPMPVPAPGSPGAPPLQLPPGVESILDPALLPVPAPAEAAGTDPATSPAPALPELPLDPLTVQAIQGKALKLLGDQRFVQALQELWQSKDRKKLLVTDLVFFVVMLLLKSWAQSRTKNWLKRALVGFGFSLATLVGVSYVIPLIVFGEPFLIVTGTLWRVLVKGG